MRHALLAAASVLAAFVPTAGAEALQVGSYEGSFEIETTVIRQNPRPRMVYLELKIERVEGSSIAASLSLSGGPCDGDHSLEGRLDAGTLLLKAARPPAGCMMPPIRLTVGANALEGTYGKRPIRLRR